GQSNKDAQSALIDAIRIRLNHAGHRKLTVRPDDKGRVEIAIPRSDKNHGDLVAQVKGLLAFTGKIEFRILANEKDDKAVIEQVQEHFDKALRDKNLSDELRRPAERGKPPPIPERENGFATPYGQMTYSWVEASRTQRHTMKLHNAAADGRDPNTLWKKAAVARDRGETLALS